MLPLPRVGSASLLCAIGFHWSRALPLPSRSPGMRRVWRRR
jgi:hypothetical protein